MAETTAPPKEPAPAEDVRSRIVAAAAALIATGGRDAATTRAVATGAGVQAPTIYRLFGDKRGLLDAVAEQAMTAYVAEKAKRQPHPDPLQDLRDGWDVHVAFGLAHPGLFAIMSDAPHEGVATPAIAAGFEVLRRRINNIARAGRLRVSEARAIALVQSVGVGTVLTLLGQPEAQRDPGLSEAAREAVIAAIANDEPGASARGVTSMAVGLRAALDETRVLSRGERQLLEELLDRIADASQT